MFTRRAPPGWSDVQHELLTFTLTPHLGLIMLRASPRPRRSSPFNEWPTLPADCLHVSLRQICTAESLCAVARSCAAWKAAVAAEPRLIEEITCARFPHLTALLKALSAPPAPLDWPHIYRNQLRAVSPRAASEVTLRDFVFTITIEANSIMSVQWTGGLDAATYASDDAIRLWTADSAPSWAFDGEPDDDDAFDEWAEALPELTLSVMASRMGASGPQSVQLCRRVPLDSDFDRQGRSFAFDSEFNGQLLPHRNDIKDIYLAGNNQVENDDAISLRPWICYCKDGGWVEAESLFRVTYKDNFEFMNAAGLKTYLVDMVPWD